MNEEIKQLLIDCANFIQPYDDGGNEAERLMERLDKALEQGQSLPIDSVSNCSQECEWKADTFDNIGMALTEYCEECGAKRDCC